MTNDHATSAGWLNAVIRRTFIACSRLATTRASRRVEFVAERRIGLAAAAAAGFPGVFAMDARIKVAPCPPQDPYLRKLR
jgi:hypothetical protein